MFIWKSECVLRIVNITTHCETKEKKLTNHSRKLEKRYLHICYLHLKSLWPCCESEVTTYSMEFPHLGKHCSEKSCNKLGKYWNCANTHTHFHVKLNGQSKITCRKWTGNRKLFERTNETKNNHRDFWWKKEHNMTKA